VFGYYGMGQWMAQEHMHILEDYEVPVNLGAARALLEEAGWVLDEEGEAYDAAIGGVRCREGEDGELEKLALLWAQPQETAMSGVLEEAARSNLEAAGIELTIVKMPFEQLLKHYYRQVDREYNMMSLASNFNLAFDPYFAFHIGEEYQGELNRTGIQDRELMEDALSMRMTPVGDDEGYVEKWLKFQERFNELKPMIPLFSNVYYDFFQNGLQDYQSNAYFSWATAVIYSYIGDAPTDDLLDDDLLDLG